MQSPIFRCNGQYFGFMEGRGLYESTGRYIGWIDDKLAFSANGEPLGELYQGKYFAKTGRLIQKRTPIVPPLPSTIPLSPGTLLPLSLPPGWEDSLESVNRIPTVEQIYGQWSNNQGKLCFNEDHSYSHQTNGDSSERVLGTWTLDGNLLSITLPELEEPKREFVIIEYQTNSLKMRIISEKHRSIPFTLNRDLA